MPAGSFPLNRLRKNGCRRCADPLDTPVAWAAYDAAGRSLLVATDTALVLVNPVDWTERVRIALASSLRGVRVSPDGARLATVTHQAAGHDEGVLLTRVFDAAIGRELGGEYTSGSGTSPSDTCRTR